MKARVGALLANRLAARRTQSTGGVVACRCGEERLSHPLSTCRHSPCVRGRCGGERGRERQLVMPRCGEMKPFQCGAIKGPRGRRLGLNTRDPGSTAASTTHEATMKAPRAPRPIKDSTFLDDPSLYPEYAELVAHLPTLHAFRRFFHAHR